MSWAFMAESSGAMAMVSTLVGGPAAPARKNPSSPWWKSDRAEMGAAGPAARREEGEYSPYLTDEQRSTRGPRAAPPARGGRRAGSARFGDGRLPPRAARQQRSRLVGPWPSPPS